MIDKAIMAVQRTGLYEIVILEWNGFDEANKTWTELKSHLTEAYKVRLTSGAGTAEVPTGSYNGGNNMNHEDSDEVRSLDEGIQMGNNADSQQTN